MMTKDPECEECNDTGICPECEGDFDDECGSCDGDGVCTSCENN